LDRQIPVHRPGARALPAQSAYLDGELCGVLPDGRTAFNSDHQIGHGPAFHKAACEHGLEGIVSKRLDGRYEPDRRSWLKVNASTAKRSSNRLA
jgi:hypothetical protein